MSITRWLGCLYTSDLKIAFGSDANEAVKAELTRLLSSLVSTSRNNQNADRFLFRILVLNHVIKAAKNEASSYILRAASKAECRTSRVSFEISSDTGDIAKYFFLET